MKRPLKPHSAPALPFSEPEVSAARAYVAHVDGASRGNPGPASYAVVLRAPDGKVALELGKYLGRATNNVAEYYALITALDYAIAQGITRLRVRSDSELLVRQMQGRYKVKSADLRPLHERAQKAARQLDSFAIEHVPREQNRDADALANRALDETSSRGASAPVAAAAASAAPAREAKPRSSSGAKPIRARYSAGALHPLEALDLAEGEMVELTLRRDRDSS